MKPFFKWSGGKRKEIKRVLKHMPSSYDTYYEPFLGAGAIWLHLEPEKSVVNDNYPDVINFLSVLKSDPIKLSKDIGNLSLCYNKEVNELPQNTELEDDITKRKEELKHLKNNGPDDEYKLKKAELSKLSDELKRDFQKIAEKYYYKYRNNDYVSAHEQAIQFYILRQLSFSGMLRFSSSGNFNVPFGWYKSLKKIEENIPDIKRVLGNTTLLNGDWYDAVKTASKNDFVFLDPPYTRKFTKYHPNGEFLQKEHEKLAEWFHETTTQAMIIINKDEFTGNLYGDYIKEEYGHKYSIQYRDRMKKADSNAVHILATNYDIEK
jgi:DNA adenine methylase